MVPIQEQGKGKGIGHSVESFLDRFDQICEEHLQTGRAKSFAFIFYDFNDRVLHHILKDQGVFTKLDRLAGSELSIFYLDGAGPDATKSFNTHFVAALGITGQMLLPCVVFFRLHDSKVEYVEIVQFDNSNPMHGFQDLHRVIDNYLKAPASTSDQELFGMTLTTGTVKFVATEFVRAALKTFFDACLR